MMSACHQRAADALVAGAIRNGGLYVKLGQGLCSFSHLLPPEYIRTLRVLEDRALTRGFQEVSPALGLGAGQSAAAAAPPTPLPLPGGRAVPRGLPGPAPQALPGVRLPAHRRREPGPGAPSHTARRHGGGREGTRGPALCCRGVWGGAGGPRSPRSLANAGAVHRPAGPVRGRRAHAGAAASARRAHASQLRLQLGPPGTPCPEPGRSTGAGGQSPSRTLSCPCGPQDLKGTLAQELDFENEGRNAERCARELRHFRYVVVPRVHWDACSKVGWAPPGWERAARPSSAACSLPARADGRVLGRLQGQRRGGHPVHGAGSRGCECGGGGGGGEVAGGGAKYRVAAAVPTSPRSQRSSSRLSRSRSSTPASSTRTPTRATVSKGPGLGVGVGVGAHRLTGCAPSSGAERPRREGAAGAAGPRALPVSGREVSPARSRGRGCRVGRRPGLTAGFPQGPGGPVPAVAGRHSPGRRGHEGTRGGPRGAR